MKFIINLLALLFVIGLTVIVGRFVLAVIGVGAATVWRFLPLILIGVVVWLVMRKRIP